MMISPTKEHKKTVSRRTECWYDDFERSARNFELESRYYWFELGFSEAVSTLGMGFAGFRRMGQEFQRFLQSIRAVKDRFRLVQGRLGLGKGSIRFSVKITMKGDG